MFVWTWKCCSGEHDKCRWYVHQLYVLWFVFFWFKFLKPVQIFQTGLNFSIQIEIFKPVYLSIYKKGKIFFHIPLFYSLFLLSYSLLFSVSSSWFIQSPSYSTPSSKSPLSMNTNNSRFYFFLFILYSPGSASHCH